MLESLYPFEPEHLDDLINQAWHVCIIAEINSAVNNTVICIGKVFFPPHFMVELTSNDRFGYGHVRNIKIT